MINIILALSLTLVGILGIIYGIKFVLKRSGYIHETNTMRASTALYLDSKRRIVVIYEGSHEHVLLLGPHHDIVIASRPLS
jgi:hypothetical protein